MKILNLRDSTKGWFVGDFEKGIVRSRECEVAVHYYHKGDAPDPHLHKIAKEITVIHSGKFMANGVILSSGDIMVLEPGEPVRFQCLEDGSATVVKSPSVPGDKYPI
ncbi:MAG: hypothetical protein V1885_01135 [Candidatus Brennerbacteria bacterium]